MSQTKTDKPKGAIVADPELAAMNRIAKTLNSLEPGPRKRVLAWIGAKFVIDIKDDPEEPAHADH